MLSPEPSAAHHHLELRTFRGLLELAKRVRRYDRVIVQFHPAIFYREPVTSSEQTRVAVGMLAVCAAARDIELRIHEFDYRGVTGESLDARLTRQMWRAGRQHRRPHRVRAQALHRSLRRAAGKGQGVPARYALLQADGSRPRRRARGARHPRRATRCSCRSASSNRPRASTARCVRSATSDATGAGSTSSVRCAATSSSTTPTSTTFAARSRRLPARTCTTVT